MSELTDEDIAQMVKAGKIEELGVLVERYESRLRRYAKRFLFDQTDSQDLLQDVFLKSFVNIQSFDHKRRFSSWIYRIAHNEFINAIKKGAKNRFLFFDPDTLFPHPLAKENPEKDLDQINLKYALDKCLDQLHPKYREPLILFYVEELDYQQISEILQIPVGTVGVRLKRGKEKLKEIYINSTDHARIR